MTMKPMRARAILVAAALGTLILAGCSSPQSNSLGSGVPTPGAPAPTSYEGPLLEIQQASSSCSDALVAAEGTDAGPGGKALPSLNLPCLDGTGSIDMADLRGPLVMTAWASWCVPCRRELPAFAAVHSRAVIADSPVRFLGLNWLDDSTSAVKFIEEIGFTFPSLFDADGRARGPLGVNSQPATLFIDRDGLIVHIERRAIDRADELTALINQHLGVEVPA
jgi:cytochrome c biogenesis protein CcmG, thiol:disulfide interchange protein DsbE